MKKKIDYNYLFVILFCLVEVLLITSENRIFGSTIDWLPQHIAFPDYFRQLFYKTHNFLPSFAFSLGAGQNIYNFSYYGLYNPLIIFSFFFPFIKMSTYISLMNIFLFILFGCLLYFYFKRHHDNKLSLIVTIILLCASPMLFHFHKQYMFVDYLPFLIIAMIGVDNYIEKDQLSLVAISIFLIIMISYYYSITCILVLCIYAIYRYLEFNKKIEIKKLIKKGLIFIIPIIIAVVAASLLLLPTAHTLIDGRTISNSARKITLIQKIIPKINLDALLYSNYSIGLTFISLLSIFYALFSKKKEDKFLSIALLILFNIPIFIYLLNGNLYFRNKILIPFIPLIGILLIKLLEAIINKKFDYKKIINLSIAIIILEIISTLLSKKIVYLYTLIIDIIYILVIILFYKSNKIKSKLFSILILIPSLIVITISNYYDIYVTKDLISKVENPSITKELDKVLSKEKNIVRTNTLDNTDYTINRIYGNNFNQNSVYSSSSNKYYKSFYKKAFHEALPYRNKLMYPQNNDILFQTFMGVKYIYTTSTPPIGYTRVSKNIYRNNNVLPVFYGTSNIINYNNYKTLEYPNNISAFLSGVITPDEETTKDIGFAIEKFPLGEELIYTKRVTIKNKDNKLVIKSKDQGYINLKVNNLNKGDILIIKLKLLNQEKCSQTSPDQRITINNISNVLTCNKTFYENNNKTFHYVISSNNKIDLLHIVFNKGIYKIGNIETYKLNYNSLNKIKENQSKFIPKTKNIDNKIEGSINMKKDGYFVTSIPFDKGFKITVDNKKIKPLKINKAFLGFKLEEGKHNISIEYIAPYQKEGLILTIIGLGGIIILLIHDKIKSKQK